MLKMKTRRLAAEGARAVTRISEIQASVAALNDEDLLDLADIFSGETPTFIGDVASTELKRRNLTLETPFDG
jgi:hypothetical protein